MTSSLTRSSVTLENGTAKGRDGYGLARARLHLGLILPNYGDALEAERLAAVAVVAEEAGFDSG